MLSLLLPYPNLINFLEALYKDALAYNASINGENADADALSGALITHALVGVDRALANNQSNTDLRNKYSAAYQSSLSLPFPDVYGELRQLATAAHATLSSDDQRVICSNAMQAAKHALEGDRSARLMRNKYRGQSGKELFYQHIHASLAAFGSHNLPLSDVRALCIYQFLQTWGSTALGFSGIGGARTTDAYTTVVIHPEGQTCVFFGERFAYYLRTPNDTFYCDLIKRKRLASVSHKGQYGSGQ